MDEHLQAITSLLEDHQDGMSITQIADGVGLNRNSTARYVDVLHSKGMLSERVIGPTKLYALSATPPYEEQVDLFKRAMDAASCGITIADAQQDDMPLIYVNDAFLNITGYSREEVLGRNCRFLQGDKRDRAALKKITTAFRKQHACTVTLRNYTKEGEMFWNELHIAPVKKNGVVTHYVGVQTVKPSRSVTNS